jgi:inosine/xanthosine triphosphate pyrophosphatase family protein
MDKLLQVLSNQSRNAQFKTVVTLNLNGKQHLFTGIASGEITLPKSEKKVSILSFNLQDIKTFAELSSELKSDQPQERRHNNSSAFEKRGKLSNLMKIYDSTVINFSNTVPTALNLKLKSNFLIII